MNLLVAMLLCFCLNPVSLSDCPETMDRGTLSDQEYSVFLDILEAAEQGLESVPYQGEISHTKILTHIGMYYGSTDGISGLYVGNDDTLYLDLDLFQTFQEHKENIDAQVEDALTHIREGSDRYKLQQASRYITKTLSYKEGEVVCRHYAMLFYKIADRLDIQTYLCYGYAGGGYHAWNMVVLDGKEYHYDVTMYDTWKLPIFLHSRGWGREFTLNNLWGNSQ